MYGGESLRLVKVTWRDACTHHDGWCTWESLERMDLSTVVSVGVLVRETKEMLVLAQALGGRSQLQAVTCIPRASVITVDDLT